MNIYVAAKFEEKETVREIHRKLEEAGHEIAYDWTNHDPIKPYQENAKIAKKYAENEIQHIRDCDVMIVILNKKGTTLLMETGAAVMAALQDGNKQVYVVGERNKSSPWLFLPQVTQKKSVEEVLKELGSK